MWLGAPWNHLIFLSISGHWSKRLDVPGITPQCASSANGSHFNDDTMQIAGPFSTCQAALLWASACVSLPDIALHCNVLFSGSFGAWLELLPTAVNECELPCATGLSTSASAWEVALVTLPALLQSPARARCSTAGTALAEPCSLQQGKNPVTSQGSHREGDLLT